MFALYDKPDPASDMPFIIKAIKFKNSRAFIELNNAKEQQVPFHASLVSPIINKDVVCSDDEYDKYCKVEKHMQISADLYALNKQTQMVIDDLLKHKGYNAKLLVGYLKDIIKESRVTTNLYTRLVNVLDETLFNECSSIEAFYVVDVSYNLEALYYQQESWVDDVNIFEPQSFAFDEAERVSIDEGMYILMFLGKWKCILQRVFEISDTPKLQQVCNKYLQKVCDCIDYVISLIHKEDEYDTELVSSFMCSRKSVKKLKRAE